MHHTTTLADWMRDGPRLVREGVTSVTFTENSLTALGSYSTTGDEMTSDEYIGLCFKLDGLREDRARLQRDLDEIDGRIAVVLKKLETTPVDRDNNKKENHGESGNQHRL